MKHYYGDKTRVMLVISALLMLMSLPFIQDPIPIPLWASILFVLMIVIIAGLISPTQKLVVTVSTIIAIVAFLIFEYYAVISYNADDILFFAINQVLAFLLIFVTYFNVKTLREMFFDKTDYQKKLEEEVKELTSNITEQKNLLDKKVKNQNIIIKRFTDVQADVEEVQFKELEKLKKDLDRLKDEAKKFDKTVHELQSICDKYRKVINNKS